MAQIDYVKLQEAVTAIGNSKDKLQDLFDKENNVFIKMERADAWESISKQRCISKYRELSSKYGEILSNLEKYKQFLLKTGESYKSIIDKSNIESAISDK